MLQTYEQQGKKKLAAIVVTTGLVAGGVVYLDQSKARTAATATDVSLTTPTPDGVDSSTPTSTPTPTPAPTSTPAVAARTTSYRNGTYSATQYYRVPHSTETIRVTLTLSGGTITDSSVENSEGDRQSATYQEEFAAAYRNYVIGRNIDQVNLDAVAGASDTAAAFNQALSQIMQQASS